MRSVVINLASRILAMVPAAIATLLATRLILGHYDVEVFNAFTLVFSLMLLIPLNDLGAGAALTTATAENGATHPHTVRVALTAARTLAASGFALVAVSLLISAFDGWQDVLGDGAYASAAYGLALALYGLSFVPGLAQSLLLGVNRSEVTILVQASFPPAMAAGIGLCVALDAPPWAVVLVPGIAILAISLLNAAVAPRETGLHLLPLMPKLLSRKRFPGTKIGDVAGPALIVVLTTPITLQSQRLILSHFAEPQDVANFSVTVQVFLPLFTLVPAAARPLWPIFARQRITGVKTVSLGKVLTLFFLGTLLTSGFLFVFANPIAAAISDDKVDLGIALPALMAGGTLIQSIAMPVSMAMMYPAGLRVIARLSLIATPVNVIGSIVATQQFGGTGPLWVGFFVLLFVQTIPCLVFIARNAPGQVADDEVDLGDLGHPDLSDEEREAELEAVLEAREDAFVPITMTDGFIPASNERRDHPPTRRPPDPTGSTFHDRWREDGRGRTW